MPIFVFSKVKIFHENRNLDQKSEIRPKSKILFKNKFKLKVEIECEFPTQKSKFKLNRNFNCEFTTLPKSDVDSEFYSEFGSMHLGIRGHFDNGRVTWKDIYKNVTTLILQFRK